MQPVAMIARPSFSWKKGLLHAVGVLAVFMFLGMIFAATGAFGNQSEKIGEAAGRQMVLAFLLAVAASYGFQTEKKALGLGMAALLMLLLAYQVVLFSRVARNTADSSPMTAAEQENPAREASRPRFCQSTLGFSFPVAGGNFVLSGLEEKSPKAALPPNVSRWLWTSPVTGQRILVQAIKGIGRTEEDFTDFTRGLKKGLNESGKASLADEHQTWTNGRGEFTITGRFTNGVHLRMRCLSRGPAGDRPPLTVCLQTFTGTEDDLQDVGAGLELAPCGIV
jgi:hypothetical protein